MCLHGLRVGSGGDKERSASVSEVVDTKVLDTGFPECRLPISRAELLSAQRSALGCSEDQRIGIGIGATDEVVGNPVAKERR